MHVKLLYHIKLISDTYEEIILTNTHTERQRDKLR